MAPQHESPRELVPQLTTMHFPANFCIVAASSKKTLQKLVGQSLVAVTFILDYFQLQFDSGSRLNVTTQTSLQEERVTYRFPEALFCSGLVGLINRVVTAVQEDNSSLRIVFENTVVRLSLLSEDFHVEAYYFHSGDGTFVVHN